MLIRSLPIRRDLTSKLHAGSTAYGNNVRIDGAVSTQSYQTGCRRDFPTLDSIEAVNVATNSFEAANRCRHWRIGIGNNEERHQ